MLGMRYCRLFSSSESMVDDDADDVDALGGEDSIGGGSAASSGNSGISWTLRSSSSYSNNIGWVVE